MSWALPRQGFKDSREQVIAGKWHKGLPEHFQTSQLRRPDLNRRGTAYETVLGTKLQSTPQYPRQDSNLR